MKVRASARDVGISPQKVRRVVGGLNGRMVEEALALLTFSPTPAARAVAKVVKSAAANAENNFELSPSGLRIVSISADEGHTMKRFRPRSRGRASPILKRSSYITVVVAGED